MDDVDDPSRAAIISAVAILSSQSHRIQEPPPPKKKHWGSCWSSYWCFGSHKNSKRIGHAAHDTEPPTGPIAAGAHTAAATAAAAAAELQIPTTIVIPFIAPPSSPVSFIRSDSDTPSSTLSPAGSISLTSLNAYSPGGPRSMFTIGPYAYETQLVSPPVFSNFTTEPSTASFTPPPESVYHTTPSSPEVPYAQLLTSALAQAHRSSDPNQKFALFNYDFQTYQHYPGSPGTQLISPGSVISTSGSSTPFPDKHAILEFHKGDVVRAVKFLSSEHFTTRKWSSRVVSGSETPDGAGQGSILGSRQGSRLGSGSLTPDSAGKESKLGSGSVTPDGLQPSSQLGSGCLTPDAIGPNSKMGFGSLIPDDEGPVIIDDFPGLPSLLNSGNVCQTNAALVDHRVSFEFTGEDVAFSFEFTGEDVAQCLANKSGSLLRNRSQSSGGKLIEDPVDRENTQKDSNNCNLCSVNTSDNKLDNAPGEREEQCCKKHTISLDSYKEFNFDNRKGNVSDDAAGGSEWWTNKKVAAKEGRSSNSWAFFPMLQPENE